AAASDPWRQGPRADGRTLQRRIRRHSRAGQTRDAAPRADELPRRVRRREAGSDHREAAGRGTYAEERDVTTGVATQAPAASFLDPAVLARIGNLELLARTVVEGFIQGLHRS